MSLDVSKIMRIITEVISYCAYKGARDWDNSVSMEDEKTIIKIHVYNGSLTDEDAIYLDNQLNIPRQKDLEHTYWGLSSSTSGNRKPHLFLAGIMVDKAIVKNKEDEFFIYLERNH